MFVVNTVLPVSKSPARFRPINLGQYQNIQKFLENNSDEELERYLDVVLSECIIDYSVNLINRVDKFYCLLFLRLISVGEIVTFKKADQNIDIKFNVGDFLNSFFPPTSDELLKTLQVGKIQVSISYPSKFLKSELTDYIQSIQIDGCNQTLNTIHPGDQLLVLKNLPAVIYQEVAEHRKAVMERYTPYNVKLPVLQQDIALSRFDESLFYFLKVLYKEALMSTYQLIYQLTSKMHMGYNAVLSISPAEANLYYSFIEREHKSSEQTEDKTPASLNESVQGMVS